MGLSPHYINTMLQSLYVPNQGGSQGGYDPDAAQNRALASVYDPTEDLQKRKAASIANALAILHAKQAVRISQQSGTMARLQKEGEAFQLPVPQQEEMASQGAFPRFNAPEVPSRPAAQVDPTARLLSGIAAGLAPGQFRGDLLTSPLQGALEHANQVYNDRLKTYQMHYQQAQQAHEDDLSARNEEAKRQAYNATVRYGSRMGAYKNAFDYLMQVEGPRAQASVERALAPYVDMNQEAAARAGAEEQGIESEIKAKQESSKEKSDLAARFASFTERLAATQLAAMQRATTATENNAAKAKEGEANRGVRKEIADNKEAGLLNRMRAHDTFTAGQKDLDRKSHEAIANIHASARGATGGDKMPASILQRKEIALNDATKATKRVMSEYAQAVTKAGGESNLDASVKQIFAKNFQAFQQIEFQARAERDQAMNQYQQSLVNRGNGRAVLPGLPGIGRHLIYDPLKGTMTPVK